MMKIGIDVGSTTAKLVAVEEKSGEILFSKYERHNAKAKELVVRMLEELRSILGDVEADISITGSVGMGLSEQYKYPFVQEVVAATIAVQARYPQAASMIDIGGEDAKVVLFKHAEASELRMNGNCAGGTGAFIDQMAVILGVDVRDLNELALHATQVYPIASRCGVFCKTDIQNLIAKNVRREDIAASIFHAVAVQTVVTLAHGCDILSPILFCGGPLTFIPALRKAFMDYLSIDESQIILPEHGALLPAYGAALSHEEKAASRPLSAFISDLEREPEVRTKKVSSGLPPIFTSEEEYGQWAENIAKYQLATSELKQGPQDVFIGIDSGSTTTKIVMTDDKARILFSFYEVNGGNPIETVEKGLNRLKEECRKQGTELCIKGSCSTGYGEELVKAAFQFRSGIVETIAHYMAAHHLNPEVSFILDIGGQDMKAIFVNGGVIDRIEINEACSSGCGSFIETFAKTLGYTAHDFAMAACRSAAPCDLGTRCTVFMNSKVKQVLREGATVDDIAAGLAYSVVKNCLYKVLKLKDISVLGQGIVVQGGTMRNDAVVRALELLTGTEVARCNCPELMGAFGCALYAMKHQGTGVGLDDIINKAHYTSRFLNCKGCNNQCLVVRYQFENGDNYYSGNKCEKVFTNGGKEKVRGANVYLRKNELLFSRQTELEHPRMTLGIPRCLNMYEDYPFWHTLFVSCGIQVSLSDPSNFICYERNARMVMSDNICFPAKLVHSHIQDLINRKVDRIFMPFVVFERQGDGQNSYNCPVVTGYSEVVKSVQNEGIPIDSPTISFKDRQLLFKQCRDYLVGLGIDTKTLTQAFKRAEEEQETYFRKLVACNEEILRDAEMSGHPSFTVLLAGRPYHSDALIQHKVSDMLSDMGINVISDDVVRGKDIEIDDAHFLAQWAYPNRILNAAKWCVLQGQDLQFVQMTSFGCGPDAFLVDEVRDLLMRHGKSFTLLKLDDINNIGSMKLRVRSLVESLKLAGEHAEHSLTEEDFQTVPVYDKLFRGRKILVPFFTPFLSPLVPAVMRAAGYDVDNLPLSDAASCEWGLKYANNEVCYPATLIVGDVIKAFKSGKYDPDRTVVAMTQTGGQCRASNYVSLIKKALVDAGYSGVPVISLTFGGSIKNDQPGFKMDWMKILPLAFRAILYTDCIAKFYYASVVREKSPGQTAMLRDKYLNVGEELISKGRSKELVHTLSSAAEEFNGICEEIHCPRVGVVGEIFLKFNPFAQKNITDWLAERKIEVVPPGLTDFLMQNFVNRKVNVASHLQKNTYPSIVYDWAYKAVESQLDKVNAMAGKFRYFIPFHNIFREADEARKVISLNAQFGEGWLLPAEIMSYARQGITDVVSLQPFGCIANHIVSKGIEKRIKSYYPDLNLLSLDFDSGVSDVNVTNRMLLFIHHLNR